MQLSYQNKRRRIALQDVGDAIIDLIENILPINGHLLARLVELCATDRAVQRNSKSVDSEFLSSKVPRYGRNPYECVSLPLDHCLPQREGLGFQRVPLP